MLYLSTLGLWFFSLPVFAEGQAAEAFSGGGLTQMLWLVGFMAIFYFMLIRPQSKRAKEHQQLLNSLQIGDEVITTGGLLARIKSISDNFYIVNLSEGVEVTLQKQAIATAVPKGTLKNIQ